MDFSFFFSNVNIFAWFWHFWVGKDHFWNATTDATFKRNVFKHVWLICHTAIWRVLILLLHFVLFDNFFLLFLAVSGSFGFLLKPSAYSVLNNKQAAHIFWPAKGRQGWGKKAHPRANSDSVADGGGGGGGEAHGRRTTAPAHGGLATQGRTEKEALSGLAGLLCCAGLCFTRARPKGVPVRLQRGTFVEDMWLSCCLQRNFLYLGSFIGNSRFQGLLHTFKTIYHISANRKEIRRRNRQSITNSPLGIKILT